MNKAVIAIDKSKSFRVYLAITTSMLETAAQFHLTSPLSTAALGRTLTAAGLMGIMLKSPKDKLTLQIKGEGEAGEILATAKGDGSVKGYISNPNLVRPIKNHKLDVGGAVGEGTITVIKDLGLKEPYMGKIHLVTGEIADDLTAYFFISEQQNTSVALGEKIDTEGKVLCCGGMIVQMLPDADPESVDSLEKLLGCMDPLSSLIEQSMNKKGIKSEEGILDYLLYEIFQSIPEKYQVEILEHKDIYWNCDCSLEILEKVIISLGKEELEAMIREDGCAEITCQFCLKKYHFDKKHLEHLLEQAI